MMMRVMSMSRSSIVRDGMRHSLFFSRGSRGSHLDVPPALHASLVTFTVAVVPASLTSTMTTMELWLQQLLAPVVLAPAAHVMTTTSTRALLILRSSLLYSFLFFLLLAPVVAALVFHVLFH
jgi:hypothetical protein